MIDKARVEKLLAHAMSPDAEDADGMWIQIDEAIALLTGYLAMRGVVEALAERDPYGEFEDTCGRLCQWCYESEQVDHAEDCEWAKARALIGPPGERTEE